MSIAEKLTAVAENQQEIEMQYFKTSFIGSGTTEASFAIPFMPDIVQIFAFSAYATTIENVYASVMLDTRAVTRWSGILTYSAVNGSLIPPTPSVVKATSIHSGLFSYENGVFTWNLASQGWVFSPYARYYVVAARFPNKDTKKMVEEELSLLPDAVPEGSTGKLLYSKARVNAVFTTEEWEALKATKPNWTFSLA